MRTFSGIRGPLSVLALATLSATCDNLKSNAPTSPTVPRVSAIEITGPPTVAPGQSAQFSVAVRLSDNTVKAPSAPMAWRTSNSSVLRVDASGLATATQQRGAAVLTVQLPSGPPSGSKVGSREILVLPDGTYRLVGTVNDAEFPATPVANARVEVTPGSLVATTDFSGGFALYGVPADATILISKDGYLPTAQSLQLSAHTTRNFQLPPSGPRLNLAGSYTLAIDVSGACSGSPLLSSDLQHRRYDAVVTQSGLVLTVTLTEPRFTLNANNRGNRFSGRAGIAGATFTLQPYFDYYYSYYGPSGYPDIAERLSNGTTLVVSGNLEATGSAAGLSGQFAGSLMHWDSRFPTTASLLGGCFSSSIQFALTPR